MMSVGGEGWRGLRTINAGANYLINLRASRLITEPMQSIDGSDL